ncbi:MAG: LysR family transcriptional regulator [Myxococcota bacterium]
MVERSLQEALTHLPRVVVFVELAQQGSFRATAKSLGLSPSTVTHHLQAMEDALGVRLIERTSRSMTLTAAGQTFLHEAEEIVAIWRRGAAGARAYAHAPVGTLVVTAPDVLSERFVVPAIARLVARYDEVQVDLRVSTATLDLLAEGIDVAIRIGPLPDSNYGMRLLDRGQHGIIATPELAARFPASHPSDLDAEPWIQFNRHAEQLQLLGPDGLTHTRDGDARVHTAAAGSLIGLILQGAGFGMIPRVLVQQEVERGDAVVVLPQWSMGPANFYAVTPSPNATDAKVQLFTDILAELFAEARARDPARARLHSKSDSGAPPA